MESENFIKQTIKLLIKNGGIQKNSNLKYYLKGLKNGGDLPTDLIYLKAKKLAEKEIKEEFY